MDPKYTLGIVELDTQHTEIEALFVTLEESIADSTHWHSVLESLCEKLRFHFYAEESIMQIFAYPETQEHTRKHLEILKSIESYKDQRLTKATIQKLTEEPMQLFFDQIISQDMGFAEFIKRNKDRLGIA